MEGLEFEDDLEDPNSAKFIALANEIIEKVSVINRVVQFSAISAVAHSLVSGLFLDEADNFVESSWRCSL